MCGLDGGGKKTALPNDFPVPPPPEWYDTLDRSHRQYSRSSSSSVEQVLQVFFFIFFYSLYFFGCIYSVAVSTKRQIKNKMGKSEKIKKTEGENKKLKNIEVFLVC